MTEAPYLQRRRTERADALSRAARLVEAVSSRLHALGVVVFGSYARGDFHHGSDIDVLVVAAGLPPRPLDRLALAEPRPGGVEPVLWTPGEWRSRLQRRDLIAVEALERGIWLLGSPAEIEAAA